MRQRRPTSWRRGQFYREAEVTAQLTHPAIVPIFDVTTKPASAFIVMAHVEGDGLHNLLRSGDHLGLSECIELLAHLASCLDYIHGQGVVHHLLGVALIRNKKWRKEAAESRVKAVELDENNPLYLGLLAALYQAQGLQLRADKIFDQVTKIDPSYEIPQLPAWASSADRGLGGLTLAQVLV